MRFTGAEIIVKSLSELGVSEVFGYVGNSILPVFDKLADSDIKVFSTVCETGAAHATDGYGRTSGRVGVVLATSGPGATNLVTGLATAYMDSSPVLAITANVRLDKLGKDSFQEIDISGIATPITKYCHIVKDIEELEREIKKAYTIAGSDRKGTALLDVPSDILTQKTEYRSIKYVGEKKMTADLSALGAAAELINKAVFPVILAGGGATVAAHEIETLSSLIGAPILCTMRGVGLFGRYAGMVGASAPRANNTLIRRADLVIALGVRFSDRTCFGTSLTEKSIIHVDIDKAELGKVTDDALKIRCGCKEFLCALTPYLNEKIRDGYVQSSVLPRNKLTLAMEKILTDLPEDIVFATDVGNHQTAFLNALAACGRKSVVVSAMGLGTMGFGLGAAIGAAISTGKRVALITGDGSFNMGAGELATVKRYGLPVTTVIFNNSSLKMVEDAQLMQYGRAFCTDTPPVDYIKLAAAYGINGKKIKNIKSEKIEAGDEPLIYEIGI